MDTPFIEQQRHRIQTSLKKLEEEQKDMEGLAGQGDISIALLERKAQKIGQLNKALQRMAHNRYGICEKCGQGIEQKRLELIPVAATCIKCMQTP